MATLDWEGLKTFALVCRAGTMSAAARELGVNQTTVARRIQRLEDHLGYPVLRRDGAVMAATVRAEPLLQTAREMEGQLSEALIRAQAASDRDTVSGLVRVAGVDSVLEYAVAPYVSGLLADHPQLRLELIGGNRNLSVAQRETDIALRLARPTSGAFHARLLGHLAYGVYGASGNLDPQTAPWVDLNEEFHDKPEQKWLAATFPDRQSVVQVNRGGLMAKTAISVRGCCLLPRCVGDAVDGLALLDFKPAGRDLWLLIHQDMAHVPRVRIVADWLAKIVCDGVAVTRYD